MNLRQVLRKPFVTTLYAERVDLGGKHVIVTGAGLNSLGYATAKTLLDWGAVVIVTTRHNTSAIVESLLSEAGGSRTIDGHDLDLADALSVREFSRWYVENYGERLDILVNNAGVHLDLMSKWKEPKLTDDGVETHWRTNYLGTAHLSHCLLPLLQKTGKSHGDARVVNVVSQLHSRGSNRELFDSDTPYESWKFYGLSKLASIHFSHELHRRYAQQDKLTSYCLHPGGASGTYTDVATKGFAGSPIIGLLRKLGAPLERLFMSTAEEGAQTQIHCATSPQAVGGHYYVNCEIAEASPDSKDEQTAKRLWEETVDVIKHLRGQAAETFDQ